MPKAPPFPCRGAAEGSRYRSAAWEVPLTALCWAVDFSLEGEARRVELVFHEPQEPPAFKWAHGWARNVPWMATRGDVEPPQEAATGQTWPEGYALEATGGRRAGGRIRTPTHDAAGPAMDGVPAHGWAFAACPWKGNCGKNK